MSQDELKDIKEKTKQLNNKMMQLIKVKDNQKESSKIINDIKKIQKDMEKAFEQLKPYLEKKNIDKQAFNNANNDTKRALNQPTEANIQNAVNKLNDFINKLAA